MLAESSNMSQGTSDDQTELTWNDMQWISSFPLNEATALHYFSLSPFYDQQCNNELVRMQQLDPSLLKTMAGIEYSVTSPCPNLFVVSKSRRSLNPPKLQPLAMYYIYECCIYQSPSLHAVLSTRMLQSLHHLRKAFSTMHNAAALSTQGKYVWEPAPGVPEDAIGQDSMDISGGERKALDDMLYDIWEKNTEINAEQEEKLQQKQADPPNPKPVEPDQNP